MLRGPILSLVVSIYPRFVLLVFGNLRIHVVLVPLIMDLYAFSSVFGLGFRFWMRTLQVTKSKPAADASVSERKTSLGCRVLNRNGRAGEGRGHGQGK